MQSASYLGKEMAKSTIQLIEQYNKTKRIFGDITVIKAGNRGLYDVFQGKGWGNHTRVFYNRKDKSVSLIKGMLTTEKLNKVLSAITS